MSDRDSEKSNEKDSNLFVRVFPNWGKSYVPEEKNLDSLTNKYDIELEKAKTSNKIKLNRNFVWVSGGFGALALILSLPLVATINLLFLSHQLTLDKKPEQLERIEKLYENAREDTSDLTKMIVPGLLTVIVTAIYKINPEKETKEEE